MTSSLTDCQSDVLLKKMLLAEFWRLDSAEALSRTLIDIVLFDRLLAHQHDLTARNLVILGEYRIKALNSVTQQVVSGDADYVLGYDPFNPLGPKQFESCSIIVEAKRKVTFEAGLAQATAYMGMYILRFIFVSSVQVLNQIICSRNTAESHDIIKSKKNCQYCLRDGLRWD